MPVLYELVVPQGNYTTPGGEKKSKWLRCGTVFHNLNTGKVTVKIECIPTMSSEPGTDENIPWTGWMHAFEPKYDGPKVTPRKPKTRKPKSDTTGYLDGMEPDDVPF